MKLKLFDYKLLHYTIVTPFEKYRIHVHRWFELLFHGNHQRFLRKLIAQRNKFYPVPGEVQSAVHKLVLTSHYIVAHSRSDCVAHWSGRGFRKRQFPSMNVTCVSKRCHWTSSNSGGIDTTQSIALDHGESFTGNSRVAQFQERRLSIPKCTIIVYRTL